VWLADRAEWGLPAMVWDDLAEIDRSKMIATVAKLLADGVIALPGAEADLADEVDRLHSALGAAEAKLAAVREQAVNLRNAADLASRLRGRSLLDIIDAPAGPAEGVPALPQPAAEPLAWRSGDITDEHAEYLVEHDGGLIAAKWYHAYDNGRQEFYFLNPRTWSGREYVVVSRWLLLSDALALVPLPENEADQ